MLNFHHAIIKGLREKYEQARKKKHPKSNCQHYTFDVIAKLVLNMSLLGQSDTQEFLLQ